MENDMKKEYITPDVAIWEMSEDVITTSGDNGEELVGGSSGGGLEVDW